MAIEEPFFPVENYFLELAAGVMFRAVLRESCLFLKEGGGGHQERGGGIPTRRAFIISHSIREVVKMAINVDRQRELLSDSVAQ